MTNKMVPHIAIDLETMDVSSTSIITSLGATAFHLDNDKTFEFHVRINWDDALKRYPGKFSVGGNTVRWWCEQSPEAQKEIQGTMKIEDALDAFSKWWFEVGDHKTFIWGDGLDFDVVILAHAYAVTGRKAPWPYWAKGDARTLVLLGRQNGLDPKKTVPFKGTRHNSLDDARHVSIAIKQLLNHFRK